MPLTENQPLSKLYYSIGEVADMLQVNASLLRFWEKEFNLVVSKKNKKGNRLFSVKEIEQIRRIYHFVKVEGYTLDGAKKALKQKGKVLVADTASSDSLDPQQIRQGTTDFTALIEKLENIKSQLKLLAKQKEPPHQDLLQTPAAIEIPVQETIQKQVQEKPKKRNLEKSRPASDSPTLFDF